MSVTTVNKIVYGTVTIPKGTVGFTKAVSNSVKIKENFLNAKEIEGWFYIVAFPGFIDEMICLKEQLDFK